ncbi:hypothetical protein LJC00_02880 [Dysgonomonas sp. OttesenSCG-928-M03]|nr:hypothetical protein [Dysgonomonas sp. OttesenSCG-928-M03]
MKKINLLFLSCFFVFVLASCNSQKSSPDTSENVAAVVNDTIKRIVINAEVVDSMVFIPVDGQILQMDIADCKLLTEYLQDAVYDTELNQSGIMMKMQAPDYTVVFHYKGKGQDESDWLMIWNENGRTKFGNEWYYLGENTRDSVYKLLEKYNK